MSESSARAWARRTRASDAATGPVELMVINAAGASSPINVQKTSIAPAVLPVEHQFLNFVRQFVEWRDVPPGPWRSYGENNQWVSARSKAEQRMADRSLSAAKK